ncbi:hypothetical protein MC7420_7814 [Coleofasciculus chthonoplastes PCC 7420]|uniref:Uncharacterized protein n=1 Tax=Coleofasciculus chthonoplastes PCC 7420 TaxID=118168 RepID=B4VIC7_9CYAN|nr:hypothetical protein MC7420_7814 [Coleofasciculus chthonoplastes PCC 7420]
MSSRERGFSPFQSGYGSLKLLYVNSLPLNFSQFFRIY